MAFVDKETPEYKMRVDERYSHKGGVYEREHDGIRNIDEVYYYIKDDDGKIGVDYVIDFKFLSIGFSCVTRRLGIDVQLEEILR